MKVFISYADSDEELARQVIDVLEEEGLDVWDEQREILPGDNWAAKVDEALQESQAMIVLLTPNALSSNHVMREIEYALGEKRYRDRLIPVIVDDQKKIPEGEIPWILRRLKTVNLPEQGNEEGIKQIAQTLMSAA